MTPHRTALVALLVAVSADGVHGRAVPILAAGQVVIRGITRTAGARIAQLASAAIQGTAVDAAGAVLPNTRIRLRNIRTGAIVRSQFTDALGEFRFGTINPGIYIVELVAANVVLAASQLLVADAGTIVATVVKLRRIPQAGLFLSSGLSRALAVTSAAAAAAILAVSVTGEDVSPR
jgi:hypothetical protein